MERVRFIDHAGKRVLLIDYSGMSEEHEFLALIELRKKLVAAEPLQSVLTLTDVTNAHCTRNVLEAMKVAAVLDRPQLKRAAIVGTDSVFPHGTSDAISNFAARHWAQFQTREEALAWVVSDSEATNA
ncbi:MAG: hypothetical protein ACRD3E_02505 [Terriglobales bacterium]